MVNYSKTKDVKENIMASAHKLFTEHGYDNVKVIDIADDAGVAKGLVFYHFNSKEGLVNEVLYSLFCEKFNALMNIDDSISPDIVLYQIFNNMFNPSGPLNICDGFFDGDIPDKFHLSIDKARNDTVMPAMLDLVKRGIDMGLFQIKEPELSFEIMSYGFNNFLHNNTKKFADNEYHKRFLISAGYLLNSTLCPTKISFDFKNFSVEFNQR